MLRLICCSSVIANGLLIVTDLVAVSCEHLFEVEFLFFCHSLSCSNALPLNL